MHQWFRRAAPGVRKARLGVSPRDMVWEGHEELAHKKWRMRVPPFLGATSNIMHLCSEFSGRRGGGRGRGERLSIGQSWSRSCGFTQGDVSQQPEGRFWDWVYPGRT